MDNKDIKAASGRRKFLVRAGMGSLPVLMALKSKGAWGYSTQNCNLSASMSKMQSAQADQFETCEGQFLRRGKANQYFASGPANGNERKGYFLSSSPSYHKLGAETYTFNGTIINENTLFNDVFGSGYDGTLAEAITNAPNQVTKNIAGLFLHSMYYINDGTYPAPIAFVDAYNNAMLTGKERELTLVLRHYIE